MPSPDLSIKANSSFYRTGWFSSSAPERTSSSAPSPPPTVLTPARSLREKLRLIIKATRQHARNLATFAFLYKATMLLLRHAHTLLPSSSDNSVAARKEGRYDTFVAGLVGGYMVFGRGRAARSSVNQQIVIYVFARVVLALAKLSVQPGGVVGRHVVGSGGGGPGPGDGVITRHAWPVFASLSWALVMWLFRWEPDTLQPSLRSSMNYMCVLHLPRGSGCGVLMKDVEC